MGVWKRHDMIHFGEALGEWVPWKTEEEFRQIVKELAIPEHNGKFHFLEVILQLVQRVCGNNIPELPDKLKDTFAAKWPKLFPSLKRMPPSDKTSAHCVDQLWNALA